MKLGNNFTHYHLISIGNSMICSDIWHNYHSWVIFQNCYYVISRAVRRVKFETILKISLKSGIYAKYHVQIMLLIVYTTTLRRFVIFTCRYFKLRWNTTALSQSNCRKLLLFCGVVIVQCLFNVFYYVIWWLHTSATASNYLKNTKYLKWGI